VNDVTTWDVFVSYASADVAISRRLVEDLTAAGFRVWHDRTAVTPGNRVREAIDDGLRKSRCVVILLSQRSLKSRWVLNELDAAMLREIKERRTLVIPVLIGRLNVSDIPSDLQGKHYIDLRFDFEARYSAKHKILIKSVELILPKRLTSSGTFCLMGPQMVSFLFRQTYAGRDVARLDDEGWVMFEEVFLAPRVWDARLVGALKAFRDRYGLATVRRLLMLVFDLKRIAFFRGFETEEMVEAMLDAQCFVWMASVHEHARSKGHRGVEFQVTADREIKYRLSKDRRRKAISSAA
jgi:hypothetical protein